MRRPGPLPPSFSRRLARARVLARRLVDLFPLTALGMLVLAASAVGLKHFGIARLDLIVLVLGYVGFGLPLVSLALVACAVIVVGRRLRKARTSLPERVDTDVAYETGFTLPTAWFLPFIEVRWEWSEPGDAQVSLLHAFTVQRERVELRARGVPARIWRRVIIGDVFGLVRIALWRIERPSLEVLPHPGALKNVPALLSMAGGDDIAHPLGLEDGDRIDLRRYAPGDPARFIHWKVYGRTRKLVVRRPERALSRAKRTVAYLVAGPDDEASAAVARVALESGALGGEWVFGADGTDGVIRDRDRALSAIAKSASSQGDGGRSLEAFLREVEIEGPASIVLFLPPSPGPWIARVQAALSRRRDARIVVGVDALLPPSRPRLVDRVLRVAAPSVGTRKDRLDETLQAFAGFRVPLTLIERRSGKVLSEAHRRALDVAPSSHSARSTRKKVA